MSIQSMIPKSRLEAFSDGVIAIIITIMVLEMKVPHSAEFSALIPVLPVFLSYILSFIYLAVYWNNHHHLLQSTKHVTGFVMWSNMSLLFWLSLFPFATGWMGENHFAQGPMMLYGGVLFMAGFSYMLLQRAIILSQGHDSLLAKAIGRDIKGKLSFVLYAVAILVAFIEPRISGCIYVLVLLMWLSPDRRIERELLKQKIKNFQEKALTKMNPRSVKTLSKGVDDLVTGQIGKNALKVGNKMPPFTLPDANGELISSDKLLKRGSLIISFYRGGWCSYCNMELTSLQGLLSEYGASNATLVAISPEPMDDALATQKKNELGFSLLSDNNNKVARSMGLVYEVPKEVVDVAKSEFNLDFSKYNKTEKHELPIPATYVVGSDGTIIFDFVKPDYTQRAEPLDILDALMTVESK